MAGGIIFVGADAESNIGRHFQLMLEVVEICIASQVIHPSGHCPWVIQVIQCLVQSPGVHLFLAGAEQGRQQQKQAGY